MKRLRDRPRSSAKEKAIPTSAIGSTVEQTFSSECQTGNVPTCSVVTKARQNWLHAKQRTLSERQGPGRERRPKWRLFQGSKLSVCMQNDRIFASLVECVLRRSFSEHWRKNGIDPGRCYVHTKLLMIRQTRTINGLSLCSCLLKEQVQERLNSPDLQSNVVLRNLRCMATHVSEGVYIYITPLLRQ